MCTWEVNMSATRCKLARSVGYFATAIALPWFIGTAAAPPAQADETYTLVAIVPLPAGSQPLASTDIAWVDADSHTYALTDRSNKSIDIIDTRKNQNIRPLKANPPFAGRQAKQSSGPNGVVIVEHKEVWAGDGPAGNAPDGGCGPTPNPTTCTTSGSFKVIDLESGATIKTIYVKKLSDTKPVIHGAADEICYNPSSDVILGASHATAFGDQFITFALARTKKRLWGR
jgi:hypothetical protein